MTVTIDNLFPEPEEREFVIEDKHGDRLRIQQSNIVKYPDGKYFFLEWVGARAGGRGECVQIDVDDLEALIGALSLVLRALRA